MEAGKNSVIYMGLISGPNKADDTCGRTTVTGTMDRGFTVFAVSGRVCNTCDIPISCHHSEHCAWKVGLLVGCCLHAAAVLLLSFATVVTELLSPFGSE
jgi:hypothetical protein